MTRAAFTGSPVISRYDDVMWALQFGSAGGDQVIGVASDAAGNVAAVGYYGNGTNFGDAQLAAVDGADAFVTMQSPDGEHLWTVPFGGDGIEAAIDVGIDPQGCFAGLHRIPL